MGLLDLVEQDHPVGSAPHRLGELAAFLVADVAGRRAEHPADGVPLLVFAHVDAHQRVLVVEQELGQRLGQLGLADAAGAQEDEAADGSPGILEPAARPAQGIGHGRDRLILADDPLVQLLLHAQQFGRFPFQHGVDRDAGPAGHHGRDVLCLDHLVQPGRLAPGRVTDLVLPGQLEPLALELGRARIVVGREGRVLVGLERHQPFLDLLERRRYGVQRHAQAGSGFVHQVDGFVRQPPVGDIAVRESGRGHQRLVGEGDLVVLFVAVAHAAQDLDGVIHRGLIHVDRRKPAFQRAILLDVLPVFIQCGGADATQFPASQRRFEHVAGVHRALGRARAHHGVQLIDEKDDLALGFLHLFDGGFEALLELAAEPSTGDHRAQVQAHQPLANQALGHVLLDDLLRQALDDGGLAHARFTDQHRIILGAPAEHLDHAQDLGVAADDRVQFAGAGGLGQVAGEPLQGPVTPFGRGAAGLLAAAALFDGFQEHLPGDAGLAQQVGGEAVPLARDAQQQMFGGDVFVFQLPRLFSGLVDHALQPRGDEHLGDVLLRIEAGAHGARGALQVVLQPLLYGLDLRAQAAQDLRRQTLGLLQQRQEQVLDVHLGVAIALHDLISTHG